MRDAASGRRPPVGPGAAELRVSGILRLFLLPQRPVSEGFPEIIGMANPIVSALSKNFPLSGCFGWCRWNIAVHREGGARFAILRFALTGSGVTETNGPAGDNWTIANTIP